MYFSKQPLPVVMIQRVASQLYLIPGNLHSGQTPHTCSGDAPLLQAGFNAMLLMQQTLIQSNNSQTMTMYLGPSGSVSEPLLPDHSGLLELTSIPSCWSKAAQVQQTIGTGSRG
jgi:hypothetical protein